MHGGVFEVVLICVEVEWELVVFVVDVVVVFVVYVVGVVWCVVY